jgi:hypothetical protein
MRLSPSSRSHSEQRPSRRFHFLLISLGVLFLLVTVCYSRMIPAWEGNDELDHVANIEYAAKHFGRFIPIAQGRWHETHQPPLYYWLGAAWQRMVSIPAFAVSFPPYRATRPENGKLIFAHDRFSPLQRDQAIALHKLRFLAPILGLMTVGLSSLIAWTLTRDQPFTCSASLLVGLHPKFLTLSAVITNDSLAVLLGSALLLLAIYYVAEQGDRSRRRLLNSLAIGLTAGAAVLTKLNLLPLLGLLIPAMLFLAPCTLRQKLVDLLVIATSSLLVCGWWLVHNHAVYGDWLALQASNDWLALRIPKTIQPVSPFNAERFLNFVPQTLFRTFWYNGGWNQLVAPFAVYCVLWWIAAVCLSEAFKLQVIRSGATLSNTTVLLPWVSAFAGVLAVLLIAQQTYQAEGRVAFIALPAFAVLLTSGSQIYLNGTRLASLGLWFWPLVLLILDIYVLTGFVLPLREL